MIRDDDPSPTVSIDDASVVEGDTGTSSMTFTVSLSTVSGRSVSIDYASADVSATAGEDYSSVAGAVTFAPGDTTEQVTVQVSGDVLDEFDETFTIELSNPAGAVILDDSATVTIVDDDDPLPSISISDATVTEGTGGNSTVEVTVTLSAPASGTESFKFATADGSATAGEDYLASSFALPFFAGQTTRILVLNIVGDTLDEPDETFRVDLFDPVNATIADDSATVTIVDDDDPLPSISISDATVTEGTGGNSTVEVTVTLSAPASGTESFKFATADGSATAGEDYLASSFALPFFAGQTTRILGPNIVGDTLDEPDETFRVDLFDPVNATIADDSATVTIVDDDDPLPSISISDATVTEGTGGNSTVEVTVTLSAPASGTESFKFATADGSATAGEDYLASSFALPFFAGQTTRILVLNIVGDTLDEPDETFRVDLFDPVNATIADDSATVTIVDDDDPSADVSILKTSDHDLSSNPIPPGERLVYTLTLTNAGPGTAQNIQISDVLPRPSTPDDAQWCEVDLPATTCDTTTGDPYDSATAIPAIEKLVSGDSRRFQIGYTVASDAPSGVMQNTASITSASTDPNAANDTSSVSVLVDVPPAASFTFTPAVPVAGDVVRFDASGSTDDGGIVGFAWEFGDGATGTGSIATHSYSAANTYVVSLTVTDGVGGTSTTTRTVVVSQLPASAGRALRGTVTQLVAFGPGGDPADGRVPYAGARVQVGTGRQAIETMTDALGGYAFTDLPCNTCQVVVTAPGSTVPLAQASVVFGPGPSLIVRDFVTGSGRDPLYVTGLILPPTVHPGDPQPPAPLTVGIRVYKGSSNLLLDSTTALPGPGGFGAYQLFIGRAGGAPLQIGSQLRIVLVENGDEVGQTTIVVPPLTGSPLVVTAADLVGQDPPPSAGRALRGTVTQLVAFGPGGDPADGRVPYAGARVQVGTGRQAIETMTDALGGYAFTDLPCNTCQVVVTAPGSTVPLAQASVVFGPGPSLIVRDFVTGSGRDPLYVTGLILPPTVHPGDPQPPAPLTVGIRVYKGSSNLLLDSTTALPGPGGFGAYQLFIGRAGGAPLQIGSQLRIVLVENGDEVGQTTIVVPPLTGSPLVVTAADLVGQDPPPSAGRALRGTVTQLVAFGPGGDPADGRVPYAGARVQVGTGRQAIETMTDALGGYAFTDLPCNTCQVVVTAPGSTVPLAQASVVFGPGPSLIVRDFVTGSGRDPLYVTGLILPPTVHPGDPQPPAPLTVGIRVYKGSSNLLLDSTTALPGPGGFGAYQLFIGRAGGAPLQIGSQLRIVLVENGDEVGQTTIVVPPLTGSPLVVTAADLVGV